MQFDGRGGGSYDGLHCVCLPRPLRLLERGLLTLVTATPDWDAAWCDLQEGRNAIHRVPVVANQTRKVIVCILTDDAEEDTTKYDLSRHEGDLLRMICHLGLNCQLLLRSGCGMTVAATFGVT